MPPKKISKNVPDVPPKEQMKSSEIRKLIKQHNVLMSIVIPKGTDKQGLINLIEKNGYKINHKEKKLVLVQGGGNAMKRKPREVGMPPEKTKEEKEAMMKKREENKVKKKKQEGDLIKKGAVLGKVVRKRGKFSKPLKLQNTDEVKQLKYEKAKREGKGWTTIQDYELKKEIGIKTTATEEQMYKKSMADKKRMDEAFKKREAEEKKKKEEEAKKKKEQVKKPETNKKYTRFVDGYTASEREKKHRNLLNDNREKLEKMKVSKVVDGVKYDNEYDYRRAIMKKNQYYKTGLKDYRDVRELLGLKVLVKKGEEPEDQKPKKRRLIVKRKGKKTKVIDVEK